MTLIPRKEDKRCFVACDKNTIDNGLCDCVNRIEDSEESFYCQSEIESEEKCTYPCDHCKEYYKPIDNK